MPDSEHLEKIPLPLDLSLFLTFLGKSMVRVHFESLIVQI